MLTKINRRTIQINHHPHQPMLNNLPRHTIRRYNAPHRHQRIPIRKRRICPPCKHITNHPRHHKTAHQHHHQLPLPNTANPQRILPFPAKNPKIPTIQRHHQIKNLQHHIRIQLRHKKHIQRPHHIHQTQQPTPNVLPCRQKNSHNAQQRRNNLYIIFNYPLHIRPQSY